MPAHSTSQPDSAGLPARLLASWEIGFVFYLLFLSLEIEMFPGIIMAGLEKRCYQAGLYLFSVRGSDRIE